MLIHILLPLAIMRLIYHARVFRYQSLCYSFLLYLAWQSLQRKDSTKSRNFKGGASYERKEKNIIRRLSDTVPKLDKDKQNYILGVAEGMAIAKDSQRDKQLQEA